MPQKTTTAPSRGPCFASGDGIICAGLPRSGTLSLSTALTTLNIGPVHHAISQARQRDFYGWEQATWCNLPHMSELGLFSRGGPFARGPACFAPHDPMLPWRRADWDRLIGDYRATSDIAAVFSESLIRNYPEAKVILVERDVERWKESFGGIFIDQWFFGWDWFVLCFLSSRAGFRGGRILADMLMTGWLGARTKKEAWAKLDDKHREHSEMVRRLVPPEQLLVFKLQDGWEPLCEFLDVPVPEGVPFPHVNDKESLFVFREKRKALAAWYVATRAGLLGSVVVLAVVMMRGRGGWVREAWRSVLGVLGWD